MVAYLFETLSQLPLGVNEVQCISGFDFIACLDCFIPYSVPIEAPGTQP
jgi:hypothetical protein